MSSLLLASTNKEIPGSMKNELTTVLFLRALHGEMTMIKVKCLWSFVWDQKGSISVPFKLP